MEFNALSRASQQKTTLEARYLNPETLGVEFHWKDDTLSVIEEAPHHPNDPLGKLLFDGCPSAKARVAKCEELLASGLSEEDVAVLSEEEFDRFWQTAGRLRLTWRGAEHRYPDSGSVLSVRHFTPSKELLADCEKAGYSREKVSECLASMIRESSMNGRYCRDSRATAGQHSKNLIKWLQYIHPDHDSGWTVAWPDALGDKSLGIYQGPAFNRFYETIHKIWRDGFKNRYGRVHGGIQRRIENLKALYERLIEKRDADIWFGRRRDDFFYLRTVARTGMMTDVRNYRPSPELFHAALRAGIDPRVIKGALDDYRKTARRRFDDVALHEWRMQRYLYHHALLAGIDVEEKLKPDGRLYRDVARPPRCGADQVLVYGIMNASGESQSEPEIFDQWQLFDGDYPAPRPKDGESLFAPVKDTFWETFVPPDDAKEAAAWQEFYEEERAYRAKQAEQEKLREKRRKERARQQQDLSGWGIF